jgi:hypothetical protein
MESVQSYMPHVTPGTKGGPIDAEALKGIYDDLVEASGATVLFNTLLFDAETDEQGVVKAIICCNKSGLVAFQAKVYVDCTGDADLVAWAGGAFTVGDEQGETQPATLCFTLTNVDLAAYRSMAKHARLISPETKYPLIVDDHSPSAVVGPNAVGFNAGHLYDVDGTKPESVSRALMRGRKLARQIRDQLVERYPDVFGNAHLTQTASQLGVREGRRIKGDYILTVDDYLSRCFFTDDIGRNCYNFDSHETKHELDLIQRGMMGSHEPEEKVYAPGESHGIPYRCLLPEKLINVLVAGRSISAERRVLGSVRVMANCFSLGEAAGMAAAFAASMESRNVHQVDVPLLRKRLLEEGANI